MQLLCALEVAITMAVLSPLMEEYAPIMASKVPWAALIAFA